MNARRAPSGSVRIGVLAVLLVLASIVPFISSGISPVEASSIANSSPDAVRESPSRDITISPGETVDFTVFAQDSDGNLQGGEWYVNNRHQGNTYGLSGSSDTDRWSHTFHSEGTYLVEVVVFDTNNAYSEPISWTVTVESQSSAPTANRDYPGGHVIVEPDERVSFSVEGEDADGDLHGAEWYVDDNHRRNTYGLDGYWDEDSWTNEFDEPGTYEVEVVIFDTEEQYSEPVSWTVQVESVNRPPEAARDAPSSEISVPPGEMVNFAIDTTDQDQNLLGVSWYLDREHVDNTYGIDGGYDTGRWSWAFNEPGSYLIEAEVFDSEEAYSDSIAWTVHVESQNQPPDLTRNSPGDEATINEGETIDFAVTAQDENSNLHGVSWYLDKGHVENTYGIDGNYGSDSWSWTFDEPGTYLIEAEAFDSEEVYSDPVSWTIQVESENSAPSVTRESPNREVSISVDERVQFRLHAEDDDGNLDGIEWYVDDEHHENTYDVDGSFDSDSWSHTFEESGTYTVEAVAFDSEESYSESVDWTVEVDSSNSPPVSTASRPRSELTVEPGESIPFVVSAGDEDGNLDEVIWTVDGIVEARGSIFGHSDTTRFRQSFDEEGRYVVEADVFDEEGSKNVEPVRWVVEVESEQTTSTSAADSDSTGVESATTSTEVAGSTDARTRSTTTLNSEDKPTFHGPAVYLWGLTDSVLENNAAQNRFFQVMENREIKTVYLAWGPIKNEGLYSETSRFIQVANRKGISIHAMTGPKGEDALSKAASTIEDMVKYQQYPEYESFDGIHLDVEVEDRGLERYPRWLEELSNGESGQVMAELPLSVAVKHSWDDVPGLTSLLQSRHVDYAALMVASDTAGRTNDRATPLLEGVEIPFIVVAQIDELDVPHPADEEIDVRAFTSYLSDNAGTFYDDPSLRGKVVEVSSEEVRESQSGFMGVAIQSYRGLLDWDSIRFAEITSSSKSVSIGEELEVRAAIRFSHDEDVPDHEKVVCVSIDGTGNRCDGIKKVTVNGGQQKLVSIDVLITDDAQTKQCGVNVKVYDPTFDLDLKEDGEVVDTRTMDRPTEHWVKLDTKSIGEVKISEKDGGSGLFSKAKGFVKSIINTVTGNTC